MNNESIQSGSKPSRRFDIVIVGAGTGGIATAASLHKRKRDLSIALIDPAKEHFYQPGWTMVGGGVFDAQSTRRDMADVFPSFATWIQQAASGFEPDSNCVVLDDGARIEYQHLVVAPGLKLDWAAVEGLEDALGKNGVTSNYRYDLAPYTWQLVQQLKSGRAVFTQPPMPIKCAGAPQKALYLSCDQWVRSGVKKSVDVEFYNAGGALFGVPDYVPALQSYIDKYQATVNYQHNLVKVDGAAQEAWFTRTLDDGECETVSCKYDMLHVCPPQCAPDFIQSSPFADANGWMDVEPHSMRQTNFENVWGLGDCTNTSNAKTMAAVRKQAPVVAHNISDVLDGHSPTVSYDGYGSCPLTVERGKIVLAEFTYGGVVSATFPQWINDGTKPTRAAWMLKAQILPPIYWHAMLKGHEWLVKPTA